SDENVGIPGRQAGTDFELRVFVEDDLEGLRAGGFRQGPLLPFVVFDLGIVLSARGADEGGPRQSRHQSRCLRRSVHLASSRYSSTWSFLSQPLRLPFLIFTAFPVLSATLTFSPAWNE